MPFDPVMLWTDRFVFLLVAVAAGMAWYVHQHEHLAAPWRRVLRSPSGMSALTVLVVFVGIGLLDTLHYRPAIGVKDGNAIYAVEVHSVLDWIVGPLRLQREKTYSAPLATHLFAKETAVLPDGREAREYPRLRFGGAHLKDPAVDWAADVARRALWGCAAASIAWLLAALAVCSVIASRETRDMERSWRAIWDGATEVPWHVILITLAVMLALVGPVIALAGKYHVLGTDKVGQDVLYQALKSIRTGLVIGTLTTLITLPFALLFGIMAGYFRRWVDDAIQYLYTTLSSIPAVLLIVAFVLTMQIFIENHPDWFPTTEQRADFRLLALCVILGVTSWTSLCRLLRGEALKLRELEYVQASHAFGASHWRIMQRHILPNVMHIVLIAVVLDFSGLVLTEAVLSYVGVGVDPTMISFGTMINNARLEMAREPMVWWSLVAAFCFMLVMVLSANLFADAVRDAFDPRVRASRLFRPAGMKA